MNIEDQAKACLKVWDELEKARAAGQVELALSILSHLREMTLPLDEAEEEAARVYVLLLNRAESQLRTGDLEGAQCSMLIVIDDAATGRRRSSLH
jgi:hypothetical protein